MQCFAADFKRRVKRKKVVIKDRYKLKMDPIKCVRVKVWRPKMSINLTMLSFCVLGFYLSVSV